MIAVLVVFSSCFYVGVMLFLIYLMRARGFFWIVVASAEYFFILGLGVFPILFAFGAAAPLPYYKVGDVGEISALAPLHVFLYAVGACAGYFSIKPQRRIARHLTTRAAKLNIDPSKAFWYGIAISIAALVLYFALVGIKVGLLQAALMRGGDFDNVGTGASYVFAKRIGLIALLLWIFLPFFYAARRQQVRAPVALFVIGIVLYLVTNARFALMATMVMPLVVYLAYKQIRLRTIIILVASVPASILVLKYGSSFAYTFSSYLLSTRQTLTFSTASGSHHLIDNFAHLFLSIDAAVKHWNGVHPPLDVVLAPLGVLPSSVFSFFHLDFLSYQFLESTAKSACINTVLATSVNRCTIPPYYTGVSAYVLPLAGGIIFGYIRFFIYGTISLACKSVEVHKQYAVFPGVLFVWWLFDQMMYFIPATISQAVFITILAYLLVRFRLITR